MATNENTELEELIRNATGGATAPPATPLANSSEGEEDEEKCPEPGRSEMPERRWPVCGQVDHSKHRDQRRSDDDVPPR